MIKRIVAMVVMATSLVLGGVMLSSPTDAAPEHPDPTHGSYTICDYIREGEGFDDYYVRQFRTIHYGTNHVTQCGIYPNNCANCLTLCFQYVWGDPHVYYYGHRVNCW